MRYYFLIIFLFTSAIKELRCNENVFSNIGGISLYDLYLCNPAFANDSNFISLDLYGRVLWTNYSDYPYNLMVNSILSLDKINSGLQISYNYSKYGLLELHDIKAGYSYSQKITDQIIVKIGGSYNFGIGVYDIYIDMGDPNFELSGYRYNYLDLGLGLVFSRLIIGLNNNILLTEKMIFKDDTFADSTSTSGIEYQYSNILARYDFVIQNKFTITPQIDYNKYEKGYISVFFDYLNKYKLGITYFTGKRIFPEDLLMISCSLRVANKIEFVCFFNPEFNSIYKSKSGWNISSKIGIKL